MRNHSCLLLTTALSYGTIFIIIRTTIHRWLSLHRHYQHYRPGTSSETIWTQTRLHVLLIWLLVLVGANTAAHLHTALCTSNLLIVILFSSRKGENGRPYHNSSSQSMLAFSVSYFSLCPLTVLLGVCCFILGWVRILFTHLLLLIVDSNELSWCVSHFKTYC